MTSEKRNAKARTRAQESGAISYTQEVIDYWPACVVCDAPIRHRSGDEDRSCQCPGVEWAWRYHYAGATRCTWMPELERVESAGKDSQGE